MSHYNDQYPPPPGQQYYPPPPREDYPQHGGRHSTSGYAAPQAQAGYTYQPPRDEGYRRSPVPPNMQVGAYQEEYDPRRYTDPYAQQSEHHRSGHGGHHAPPPASYDDRPTSRSSKDHGKSGDKRGAEKSVGATLLGGAAGAFAGHEVGKGGMSTLIGALAGAYGGHELEKRHEKKREGKRRESESVPQGDGRDSGRRSTSRRRSRGSRRDSSSDSDDYDRRRRQSHQRY